MCRCDGSDWIGAQGGRRLTSLSHHWRALAPYLYGRKLVVINAVHADLPPAMLSTFCEDDFLTNRAKLRITGHDPGLWDALAHLRLANHGPSELIAIGATPQSCRFGERIGDSMFLAAVRRPASG